MIDNGEENASEIIVESLTRRELEILALLAENLTNDEIASRLTLAPSSVKWYTKQVFAKLNINHRRQVAERAAQLGLLKKTPESGPPQHNLPVSITPFVGRQNQVDQVRRMLINTPNRLITLTGAGGVGKTRLALKVAETMVGAFRNGVWLAELASLNDPALVDQTVAEVFSLHESNYHSPRTALQNYLRDRHLLLILDNCEQLIDTCASLVVTLLRFCPNLQILVTSREALGVEGEVPFSVPSLTFPNPLHLPPIEALPQYEAVSLFMDRCRALVPDFRVTEVNAQSIAQICKRLDGIPLAVELAAARVKVLPVEEIAVRLEDSFQLLSGGFRTALPRHQTMRASIEWSYRLLSENERTLIRRFSVFSGGWSLEAAEAVCSDELITEGSIIDLLTQLVNKSMVIVDQSQGIRYYLLDAIWEYCLEKLNEAGELQDVRSKHLAYYLKLAKTAEANLGGGAQVAWLDRAGSELANFRSALDWGLKTSVDGELRIASALMRFWQIRGSWTEGLDWLTRGLSANRQQSRFQVGGLHTAADLQHAMVRAEALSAAGFLCLKNFQIRQAASFLEECLSIYRSNNPDEKRGIAFSLLLMAACTTAIGEYGQAPPMIKESQSLFAEAGDRLGVSECLSALASNEEDPIEARKLYLEELAMRREIGDTNGLASTLQMLGELTVYETDFDQAFRWLEESLGYYQKVGNKKAIAKDYQDLAWLAWITGNYQLAIEKIEAALLVSQDIDEKYSYAKNLLVRSDIQLSRGQYQKSLEDILQAEKIGQKAGDRGLIASAQVKRGRIHWIDKENDQAAKILNGALTFNHTTGNKNTTAFAFLYLGRVAINQGELSSGETFCLQSAKMFYELNFWSWDYIAYPLEALAVLARHQKEFKKSARLFGASNHLFQSLPHTLSPLECSLREQEIATVQQTLGSENYKSLWREGYQLTTEQVLQYASKKLVLDSH